MAYRGPTWVSTDDWKSLQKRQFDEAVQGVDLPSEPLRVRNESDQFREIAKTLPLPSDQLRTATETDAFQKAVGGVSLPSQGIEIPSPPPAAPSQPAAPASPDGSVPPSGAPSDDPVAKTVAFLRGLLPQNSQTGAASPSGGAQASVAPADAGFTTPPPSPDAVDPSQRMLGPTSIAPSDVAGVGVDVPVPGPAAVRAAAVTGANAVGAGIDAAAGAIDQHLGRPEDMRAIIALETQSRAARSGGPPLTPDEQRRLDDVTTNTALALSGDPLASEGGALARGLTGPLEGAVPEFGQRMEQGKIDAMRRRNAGDVRGPGGADYSAAAEEAHYRAQANDAPLWQSDWVTGLEDPSSYGARPPDEGAATALDWQDVLGREAPQTSRPEVLASLNRGDLLAQLKRLGAATRSGDASPVAASAERSPMVMPGGPVPEDVAQGRYQLPGVLGDRTPPPLPSDLPSGLRQRDLPGIGEDLGGIKTPQTVPAWRHVAGNARDVIGAPQNGEFGQQLAGMVHDVRDNAATMRGAWIDDARDALALPPDKFTTMVDVLEGKGQTTDPAVQRAADATKGVFDQVYERARRALPDVKAKIPDYFPHVFDPNEFKGEGYQRAVRHLIDTGQAKTVQEAGGLLGKARRYSSDFRKSGNLENAREVDYPFYLKTKDALVQHLSESARRIAEAESFGPKGELKDRIVAQIAQDGGDAAAVDRAFSTALEQGDPPSELARGASRVIRSVESAAHLGLSGLSNATQLTNTAAVFGVRRTAANVAEAMSPAGLREAVRAGVIDPATIEGLKQGTGATKVLGMVTAPGMGRVEVMNRSVTYHTAADFASEMARKAAGGDQRAAAALKDLGLDAASIAQRGTLTDAERVRAGRIGVERTQFYVDPQDLPGWATSPAGKVVTQFRTFGYQQSRYIGREILTPLMHGDPRPLLKYVAVATALGVPVDTAYDVLSGRGVKPGFSDAAQGKGPSLGEVGDIALGGLARAGGLGLAGDVYRGAKNIGTLPPEMAVSRSVGLVGGPAVSTGADLVGAAAAAASALRQKPGSQAHPMTPLYRTALGLMPIVGPALQNTLTPYKTREAADAAPAGRYVLPGRSSGREGGRSSGRSSGR